MATCKPVQIKSPKDPETAPKSSIRILYLFELFEDNNFVMFMCLCYAWPFYKMVTQDMLRTHAEKIGLFLEKTSDYDCFLSNQMPWTHQITEIAS